MTLVRQAFVLALAGILAALVIFATDEIKTGKDSLLSAIGKSSEKGGSLCPPDMIAVNTPEGVLCVDRYENTTGKSCPHANPTNEQETRENVSWPECKPTSAAGKKPWTNIALHEAATMCARADVVAEKLRLRIDAKAVGSITADERSNQLLVRVFPGRKDEVEKIIQSLDEPTKEVLIEARVLQIILKPKLNRRKDQIKNQIQNKRQSNHPAQLTTKGPIKNRTISHSNDSIQDSPHRPKEPTRRRPARLS
jgi:hypothetical protein